MTLHLGNEFSFALLESEMEAVWMEFMLSDRGSLCCFLDPYFKKILKYPYRKYSFR